MSGPASVSTRAKIAVCGVVLAMAATLAPATAEAQFMGGYPMPGPAPLPMAGGMGPMGYGAPLNYGYGGIGSYGGFGGYGGPGGYGLGPMGSYAPFARGPSLYQQQAFQTQSIYQAQQQAILAQLDQAQARLAQLNQTKQFIFDQYQTMNEADKARFRAAVINKYSRLAPIDQAAWQAEPLVQTILADKPAQAGGGAPLSDVY